MLMPYLIYKDLINELMLNETHYPSKWTVATFFLIIFLMIVGVFAWAFYFNLGTLKVIADREFQMFVNGETLDCQTGTCSISLPPESYIVNVKSEGYYSQEFLVQVPRFESFTKSIEFDLIPYLRASDKAFEDEEFSFAYRLEKKDEMTQLLAQNDDLISSFESLNDPVFSFGAQQAAVVDEGRLFFVDLETGRKQRRFDDDIFVRAAKVAKDGIRTVLFVTVDDIDQVWMWFHDSQELFPMTWSFEADLFAWDIEKTQSAYLITKDLGGSEDESFLDDLLDVVDLETGSTALYRYNFDSDESQLIEVFDLNKTPKRLLRNGLEYFIEYEDSSVDQIVVSD